MSKFKEGDLVEGNIGGEYAYWLPVIVEYPNEDGTFRAKDVDGDDAWDFKESDLRPIKQS